MVPHAVGDRHGGEASDSLVAVVLVIREARHMGAHIVSLRSHGAIHREGIGQKRSCVGWDQSREQGRKTEVADDIQSDDDQRRGSDEEKKIVRNMGKTYKDSL